MHRTISGSRSIRNFDIAFWRFHPPSPRCFLFYLFSFELSVCVVSYTYFGLWCLVRTVRHVYDAIRHGDISVLACLLDLIAFDRYPSVITRTRRRRHCRVLPRRPRQVPVDHRCPMLYCSNSLVLFSSRFLTPYTQPSLFRTRRATATITPPHLPVLVFGRRTMIRCPVSV